MHRIALLAPVSPIRSALVDHIEGLLPGLATRYDVTLVTDGTYQPAPQTALDGRPITSIPVSVFDRQAESYDLIIYQLGDEANIHGYQFDRLYRLPGLVLLHDLVLHHALVERTLNRGNVAAYLAEMRHAYGKRGVEAARQVIAGQEGESVFSTFPLCERVVASSLATVGLNGYMCGELERRCPDATIYATRYGFYLPDGDDLDTQAQTSRRPGRAIGSFGIFHSQKRLDLALDAFRVIALRYPDVTYHLFGARREDSDLINSIAARGLTGRVLPSGWLDRQAFCAKMRQVDLALQLRWPHVGGTPYTPIRLLGLGVPTIISDIEPLAELPSNTVVRIEPGQPDEASHLVAAMDYLLTHSDIAAAMGAQAKAHIAQHYGQQAVLDNLCSIIDQVIANKPTLAKSVRPGLTSTEALDDGDSLLIGVASAALSELGISANDAQLLRPAAEAIADLTHSPSEHH